MDPDVESGVQEAIKVMEENGAEIQEISLPHSQYALPVYYIIASAEASSNLARYDGVRYGLRTSGTSEEYGPLYGMYASSREEGFGDEVKRRIMPLVRLLRRLLHQGAAGEDPHLPRV